MKNPLKDLNKKVVQLYDLHLSSGKTIKFVTLECQKPFGIEIRFEHVCMKNWVL